ncbi:MAG: hypothetical protein WAM81_11465 [Acidimicrobiia bacterium]
MRIWLRIGDAMSLEVELIGSPVVTVDNVLGSSSLTMPMLRPRPPARCRNG